MRNGLSFEQKKRVHAEGERHGADLEDQAAERHYAPAQVAEMLSLSVDKVRRMFENEPGVLIIGDQSTKHKRRYTTMRIPESVLLRVVRRMSNL